MRRLIPAHLVFFLILALPMAQSLATAQLPSSSARMTGRLWGQVIDLRGDPVGSVHMIFSGESSSHRAVTDENGKYDVELPAGEYRVSAVIAGFSEFYRAKISLPAATTKMLNIVPAFGGVTCILDVTGRERDPDREGIGPPQYEKLSLPQLSGTAEELVVRFQLKKRQGRSIEYRGGPINPAVMVSQGFLAIYAEKVRIDNEKGTIEAAGKVIVEDGEHRMRVKYAKLEVRDRKVVLTTDRSKIR